jgi:hypothetical protein
MAKRKLRIAVVELDGRHDEVFPVWLNLAENMGTSLISSLHHYIRQGILFLFWKHRDQSVF